MKSHFAEKVSAKITNYYVFEVNKSNLQTDISSFMGPICVFLFCWVNMTSDHYFLWALSEILPQTIKVMVVFEYLPKRSNVRARTKNMPNLPGFGHWIISAENRPSQSPTLKSTKQQTGIKYLIPHSLSGFEDLAKTVMAGKQPRVTAKIRKTLIP